MVERKELNLVVRMVVQWVVLRADSMVVQRVAMKVDWMAACLAA
jgi:hypothetical protein